MTAIATERVVRHPEHAGFVVMKRPPIGGGAALGRGCLTLRLPALGAPPIGQLDSRNRPLQTSRFAHELPELAKEQTFADGLANTYSNTIPRCAALVTASVQVTAPNG
jgi:hypothetical protein